jgi:hypothetical protein
MHANTISIRDHPETARVGIKWTTDEDEQLMQAAFDGLHVNDIAKTHQRTVSGVKSRLMTNALNMMSERNLTLQEVAKQLHISIEELENHKQMRKDTKQKAPSNDKCSDQKITNLLTEIRDYLKIIAEK